MKSNRGIVLISVLAMLIVLAALLGAYVTTSQIELASTKYSKDTVTGFYAAEAGLNLRAEEIRQTFVGYNVPAGVGPDAASAPCEETNTGSGDFTCKGYTIGNRNVVSYAVDDPSNPIITTIPPGELYQGLNAQEFRYTTTSFSEGVDSRVESVLELKFKSRLVPLFQFAAFYDKDLEILPGPLMNLRGPVHTNGDLYLNSNTGLNVIGQVTAAGDIYRGRKNVNQCNSTPITVTNPTTPLALIPSCSTRVLIDDDDIDPYNGMIQYGVTSLTVPDPGSIDPEPGQIYWDKADVRLVLHLTSTNALNTTYASSGVEVWKVDQTVDAAKTTALNACSGSISSKPVGNSLTFYNNREALTMRMLEIDLIALLNCAHIQLLLDSSKALDDSTEGGLVFHVSVNGPDSANTSNNYGIRIRNAASLQSTVGGAPLVKGLTIVTDQAAYIHGNFNSTAKIPSAVMADTVNPLSTAWNLNDSASTLSLSNRNAANTTVNAAFLANTDTTGGIEGSAGQGGSYNGGLENYPRFHENWTGRTFTYRGSFVSLGTPRHVDGAWIYGGVYYTAPNRDWDYDTSFNNAANLPPLTPRFVYLRQELFVRRYEY